MINLVKFDLADGYSFVCAHIYFHRLRANHQNFQQLVKIITYLKVGCSTDTRKVSSRPTAQKIHDERRQFTYSREKERQARHTSSQTGRL